MFRLVGKLGVGTFLSSLDKDTVDKILKLRDAPELMKDVSTAAASLKITNIILVNMDAIKPELYELLERASGMTEQEIVDLDVVDFIDLLDAFFSRADTWDFFMRVSRLISTER